MTDGKTQNEILNSLVHYNGSENFYRDPFNKCIYTDGYQEFMELTKSHWLFSDMAIKIMMDKKLRMEDFIVIKINKNNKDEAVITLEDGNNNKLYSVKYGYTDFPLDKYEFFVCRNEFNTFTFMLKGEY